MKNIVVGFVTFLVLSGLLVFSANAETPSFAGTYTGTFYPGNGGPQDMVLSLGEDSGYATFYHVARGTRKAAPIAKVASGDDGTVILTVTHLSSGERRQTEGVFPLKLTGDKISGYAFGGSLDLKRVDLKACPVDLGVNKIVAPC